MIWLLPGTAAVILGSIALMTGGNVPYGIAGITLGLISVTGFLLIRRPRK